MIDDGLQKSREQGERSEKRLKAKTLKPGDA
jgi:hypothetical protein